MPTDELDPSRSPTFVPDDAFVAAVRHGVSRHRRRTRRRLGAGATLVAVLAGSGIWYANDRLSSVQRIDLGTDPTTPDPVADGTPFNLLVVGLDRCEAADNPVCANRLELGATQIHPSADTIAVVHIDPRSQALDVLSVPRDLLVDGGSKWSALSVGEIAAHLRDDLGIEVDHALTITMSGFRDLADDLALRLSLATAVRDRSTGLDLDVGCQQIDGAQLLALVRARHLQFLRDGAWEFDQTGDVGRMARQQQLLRAVFDQLRALDLGDARTLGGLLDALAVDDGLTNADLVRLAQLSRDVDLRSITTLPTRPGGGASMSFVTPQDAATVNPVLAPFGGSISDEPGAPTSTLPTDMEAILDGMASWAEISAC